MRKSPKRLSPQQFEKVAELALKQIFKALDPENEPFQDKVEEKLILDLVGFWLNEEQFRSLCVAAQAVGDQVLMYSVVRGYLGGPELMPYYTWELQLWDYSAYCDADDEPPPKEKDIGIPLDRVLYSPSGKWGILLPDLFALVGGSAPFVRRFKEEYARWRQDLDRFIEARTEAAKKRNADMAWVPSLLHHMYGDDAPPFQA